MSNFRISNRAEKITSSAIREILKVANEDGVISFAGGVPSPLTFPIKNFKESLMKLLDEDPIQSFQYASTEGYLPLREWIASKHDTKASSILITTGSQQALDLIAKVFIEPHEPILVESPTYLGALQAFNLFDPKIISLPYDTEGVNVDEINIEDASKSRFIYVMPNFQNPTGTVMSINRRLALIKKMEITNTLIIEDDPYRDLIYNGKPFQTLYSMNKNGVIYIGSFSKILAPGLRVGYIIAPDNLINKLIQVKQAADLHTPILNQKLVFEVLKTGFLKSHTESIRKFYSKQCKVMLAALEKFMPSNVSWTKPQGGMFIWLKISNCDCTKNLLNTCLSTNNKIKVAFVPGTDFFSEKSVTNTLRLSFATVPEDKIILGIEKLSEIIKNNLPLNEIKLNHQLT